MHILKAGKKENWEKNTININMSLTYTCNFSCSYCFNKVRRANNDVNVHLDLEILKQFLNDLSTLQRDGFSFAIAGGEPTIYKHIFDFFRLLEESELQNKTNIIVATNGSRLDRIEKCIDLSPNLNTTFTISMHETQKDLNSYKKDISRFPYPKKLKIKYMCLPGKLEEGLELKDFFMALEIPFSLHSISKNNKIDPEYTAKEIEELKKYEDFSKKDLFAEILTENGTKHLVYSRNDFLINPSLSNFYNMYCTAGMNHLNITPSGLVYRCYDDKTGVEFSLKNNSILNYPNLTSCQPCQATVCQCMGITALPKWRKGEKPPHYVNPEYLV